jgi:hypothetical protein
MAELRAQLKEIQTLLHQSGVSGSPDALVEHYAEKLRETAETPSTDPNRLVTDLLTRCLLWAELIEQR